MHWPQPQKKTKTNNNNYNNNNNNKFKKKCQHKILTGQHKIWKSAAKIQICYRLVARMSWRKPATLGLCERHASTMAWLYSCAVSPLDIFPLPNLPKAEQCLPAFWNSEWRNLCFKKEENKNSCMSMSSSLSFSRGTVYFRVGFAPVVKQ